MMLQSEQLVLLVTLKWQAQNKLWTQHEEFIDSDSYFNGEISK